MLQKKPGKYIHGGCGAIIIFDLRPGFVIAGQTECGLGKVYCEACKINKNLGGELNVSS